MQRLMRSSSLFSSPSDALIYEIQRNMADQIGIPLGVYVFFDELEGVFTESCISTVMPHIRAFARGELTDKAMADLYLYLDEVAQLDYGWVLLDRPMWMCWHGRCDASCKPEDDEETILADLIAFGTRSQKKAKNLRLISGWV